MADFTDRPGARVSIVRGPRGLTGARGEDGADAALDQVVDPATQRLRDELVPDSVIRGSALAAATTGQVPVRQANGTWAPGTPSGSGGGVTDFDGGTPDGTGGTTTDFDGGTP
jgi:hypothetical protein